jgi:hypothetical protein
VEGTGTFYDGSDLYFDDCGGGNGHPFLYEGGTTSFVFGSDGFLHVESCFNVMGGTFQGDEPAPFWFDDPTRPGNEGFIGAPCSDVGGYLACTGTNGETVFFFPDDSFGIDTTLNIGDANYGTPVDPKINY